ncbi:MAG: hypothetical protein P1U89_27585 [Verrucomicrobiales bacterium]|nr:hypothetical protein [Verrucomicrobiales bacterium]
MISIDSGRESVIEEARSLAYEIFEADLVKVVQGPQKGFVANFLSMTVDNPVNSFVAFSDQDDVWSPDHLEKSIRRLENAAGSEGAIQDRKPLATGGRTRVVDSELNLIGLSPLYRRPPDFRNALVQCIGGGNTIVMNPAAHQLIQTAGALEVISHDWWVYLLVTGAGGKYIYSHVPTILYRQHNANLVGGKNGLKAKLIRLYWLMAGRFRNFNSANLTALEQCKDLLTEENRQLVQEFQACRNRNIFLRTGQGIKLKLYRQTPMEQAGLLTAFLLKKL